MKLSACVTAPSSRKQKLNPCVFGKGAADFLSSELGQRLIAAPSVECEWPFTMQLREGSPTMVQGIVDAAFLEDGKWILVDYKTDRDTREGIFVPRHEKLMNWYRTADGIPGKRNVSVCFTSRQSVPGTENGCVKRKSPGVRCPGDIGETSNDLHLCRFFKLPE